MGELHAAEILNALAGAGAVYLLLRLLYAYALPPLRLPMALLLIAAPTAVRFAAEAYAEPLFLLLIAGFVVLWASERMLAGALLLGLAYWVRPEAAALGALLLGLSRRRVLASLLAICVALGEPVLRWIATGDFTLTPLLGFYGLDFVDQQPLLERLLAWPEAALRGTDLLWMPFALFGLLLCRRQLPGGAWRLGLAFALLQLAQLSFQVKPRFFQSQLPLLVLLAACFLREFSRSRFVRSLCWAVAIGASVLSVRDLWKPPRSDKLVELMLGESLREESLLPGELLTDMPRVAWAAGVPPPPPAEWTVQRLRPLLAQERVRVVVFGAKREGRRQLATEFAQIFRAVSLPPELRKRNSSDRLLLLRRR
ncbi:MAG: hypothetical protein CSA62_07865 [Planctomycetota bacterium]|nr:MAG: hypothetical protein CSA62_07865 [Planctomycetota bacterium]